MFLASIAVLEGFARSVAGTLPVRLRVIRERREFRIRRGEALISSVMIRLRFGSFSSMGSGVGKFANPPATGIAAASGAGREFDSGRFPNGLL